MISKHSPSLLEGFSVHSHRLGLCSRSPSTIDADRSSVEHSEIKEKDIIDSAPNPSSTVARDCAKATSDLNIDWHPAMPANMEMMINLEI